MPGVSRSRKEALWLEQRCDVMKSERHQVPRSHGALLAFLRTLTFIWSKMVSSCMVLENDVIRLSILEGKPWLPWV